MNPKLSYLLAHALAAPIPAMIILARALAAHVLVTTTLTVHVTTRIILRQDTPTVIRLRMVLTANGQWGDRGEEIDGGGERIGENITERREALVARRKLEISPR